MEWEAWTVTVVISLLLFLFIKATRRLRYFEDRKIPYVKSKYFIGSDPWGVLMRRHIGESWDLIYKELQNEKVGGFFQAFHPFLMINDPEYINEVLTTSFDHFVDRHFHFNEETNPLDANLFFLKGNRWKYLRSKLSPFFSSGKLKWMYEEMEKCGDAFMESIDQEAHGKDVDIGELLARYATDVIGNCAFGLEPEGFKDPNSKLREIGKSTFNPQGIVTLMFLLQYSIPHLLAKLNLRSCPRHVEDFFFSTTEQILAHRRKTGAQRKDFIQLLLQLQDQGSAEIDLNEGRDSLNVPNTEKIELTDNLLAAQSFIFFSAGFETTTQTLHYLLYLLAKHQHVQEKARKEIHDVKSIHGSFSYDALRSMVYLEKCISETLRLYPVVPSLTRECTKDYTLPDGTQLQKGLNIAIPLYSIQRDPRYFPEPLEFNPDRFDSAPRRGTYLPFGDGPRICIGKRFSLVEMKSVTARLLERYKFEYSSLNEEEIQLNPRINFLRPKNGLWVKITKLKKDN